MSAAPFLTSLTYNDLALFYHNLTHHIIPGPQSLSYFVPILVLPLALLIPPSLVSHQQLYDTFLPIIYAWILHAWYHMGGVDVISLSVGLWSTVLLRYRDVREDFKRVRAVKSEDGKGEKVVEEGYPDTFGIRRVQWVLTLLLSLRYVGWRIGEEVHDKKQLPQKQMSRRAFLRHAVGIVALDYFLLNATFLYVRCDPYFTTSGMGVDTSFPPFVNEAPTGLALLQMLPPRLLRSAILAAQTFAMVSGGFYLPTIPAVCFNALGLVPDEWSPHNWPTFFGSFSAVYKRGLRGVWGSWWHQMDREMAGMTGRALARMLRLPQSSMAEYICIVATAFFLTGFIHMGLIPPEPLTDALTANEMRLYIAGFFWAQVPGIASEIAMSRLLARHAPFIKGWRVSKVVVFVWTASWLCLTLPLLVVPFREIGYWRASPVPLRGVEDLWAYSRLL